MKTLRILFFLLITFNLYGQDKTIILKVNPIKGESTVTSLSNQNSVEKIIQDGFIQKGYKVLTKANLSNYTITENQHFILVDAFIYQYPADYPSITLTIRKDNHVLELLHKTKRLFTDRQSAIESLAKNIIGDLPASIQETNFLMPELENLLPHHTASIYTATSGAITNSYSNKYVIDLKNNSGEPLDFIGKDSFEEYFSLCLDFNGYRKAVKDEPISIDFEVDKFGFTNILNIKLPPTVKDKYKDKIEAAIEAIPLWSMKNGQLVKGTLMIGMKKKKPTSNYTYTITAPPHSQVMLVVFK